ncbi:hypothetical protein BH10BDE1_BH10BDE1_29940 [soil metagenome]
MKSVARGLIIALLATAFWAFVFESFARVYIAYAGDPLDRARLVLEPNERYMWRVRPDFSGNFEGAKLTTEAHGFRHVDEMADWIMLGPSSAFGWGVEESETYFARAAKTESVKYANLSQIGYGLSQGQRLFEDFRSEWRSRPLTVFVSYGVNDVDRFRFFGPSGTSDEDAFSDPKLPDRLAAEYWLYRAAFPALLMRRLQEATFKFGCPPSKAFAMRTTNDEFVVGMTKLISALVSDGHRAVILNSPFRYPFEVQNKLAEKADEEFAKSANEAEAGRCQEARVHFAQGRVAEPHRVALAIKALNERLEIESARRGWTLVDIAKPLTSSSDFVDPIHFSKSGHEKVESAIREGIHHTGRHRP